MLKIGPSETRFKRRCNETNDQKLPAVVGDKNAAWISFVFENDDINDNWKRDINWHHTARLEQCYF